MGKQFHFIRCRYQEIENSARLNFLWGEALRDKAIEYQNKNNTPSPSAVLEKNSLMYRAYLWKSILAVKKGIAIYPKHANAYDRVGFAFYSLHPYYPKEGFLDSAVYYYSRALQLNPKSIITQYNIAIAYYNKAIMKMPRIIIFT
jgi:tetratricopeptide (TPR) repeat protein